MLACGRVGFDPANSNDDSTIGAAGHGDLRVIVATDAGIATCAGADCGCGESGVGFGCGAGCTSGPRPAEAWGTSMQWVRLEGGDFLMGSWTGDSSERPARLVSVATFSLLQSEVTSAQYARCVDDGSCPEPYGWSLDCYWDTEGYEHHPVNCVSWTMARSFCRWAGGRLPTEAEWEYAARSRGARAQYPWGDQSPSCDRAVMNDSGPGCGKGLPWAVCSRTEGHTEQQVCDMAGNVFEWVEDTTSGFSRTGVQSTPQDRGRDRVVRGGSFQDTGRTLRARARGVSYPEPYGNVFLGFRCAREIPH